MKKFAIAGAAVLVLMTAGCASDNAGEGAEEKSTLDGNYKVGTVRIKGHDVTCVTLKDGIGDATWGGLSCDFDGALDKR